MSENFWGLALWLWLLGAPLVGAFIELGRNGLPSRERYEGTSRAGVSPSAR